MPAPTVNVPLTLSYDTRGVDAWTNQQAGEDQRRVNCHYEITRTAVDSNPDIALARRPGVTADSGTFGATSQAMYVVGRDPASSWDPTPWAFVKDGSANKVVADGTSVTLVTDANYYPRFVDYTNLSGSNYSVVQLQNSTAPGSATSQEIYYATTFNGWTKISNATFTGLAVRGKMEHLDGYAFIAEANNRIYQSALNDLGTWTSSDYITKSSTSDPPQTIAKVRDQILLFGTETVEVFRNAGNASGSVLSRVTNSHHKIGMAVVAGGGAGMTGKTSLACNIGDLLFFVGRYAGGRYDASLVAYDSTKFIKLSKPYEDTLLSTQEIYGVHKFSFHGKPAVAIQFTLPTATTQKWLLFAPDVNEFFEWESTVYGPANNGYHYAGCGTTNKLYYFPPTDHFTDAGSSYTMTAQFRLPMPDLNYKYMARCEVIADTLSSSQNLGVQFSDDDGQNWTTARNIDLSLTRKQLYRCGTFRERFVRLTHTGTGECRLRRFVADVR